MNTPDELLDVPEELLHEACGKVANDLLYGDRTSPLDQLERTALIVLTAFLETSANQAIRNRQNAR